MARETSGPADDETGLKNRDLPEVAIELDRKAFLLALGDRLRPLTDPAEIQYAACEAIGQHLGANRVGYAEDQGDGERVILMRNYVNGAANLEGRYRYTDLGPELEYEVRTGRTFARSDVANDPALSVEERNLRVSLDIGASAHVPLTRRRRLVALMFVHFAASHEWSPEELSLIEETAERTCAAIERGRAEAALAESERRLQQALD